MLPPDEHAVVMDALNSLETREAEVIGMWTSSDPPAVYFLVNPRPHLSISYREVPPRYEGDPGEILVAAIYRQDFSAAGRWGVRRAFGAIDRVRLPAELAPAPEFEDAFFLTRTEASRAA
jgi:hypothetical protein